MTQYHRDAVTAGVLQRVRRILGVKGHEDTVAVARAVKDRADCLDFCRRTLERIAAALGAQDAGEDLAEIARGHMEELEQHRDEYHDNPIRRAHRFYISGPITSRLAAGETIERVCQSFWDVDRLLRIKNYVPVLPFGIAHPHTYWAWEEYLRRDLRLVCQCGGIVLMPGWRESKGALLELYVAWRLGLAIYEVDGADLRVLSEKNLPFEHHRNAPPQWCQDATISVEIKDEHLFRAMESWIGPTQMEVLRRNVVCSQSTAPGSAMHELPGIDQRLVDIARRYIEMAGDHLSSIRTVKDVVSDAEAEEALARILAHPGEQEHHEPESVLQEAHRLVYGPRNKSYGHPADDFAKTAALWAPIFTQDIRVEVDLGQKNPKAPGYSRRMVINERTVNEWAIYVWSDPPPEHVGLAMNQVKVSRELNMHQRENPVDGAGYWGTVQKIHDRREGKE